MGPRMQEEIEGVNGLIWEKERGQIGDAFVLLWTEMGMEGEFFFLA